MDTQLRLLRWMMALLLASTAIAAAESPATGVRACYGEKDATRRLACYDAEVGKMITGEEVHERVATVTHRPNGTVVLRLVNDQVWEQAEEGPDLKIEAGDLVKIDRGMLGSYWLTAHSRVAIKVRRTQ
jgi:hypothetical protein